MKQVKITPPEGYEIDRDQSTFENIVFKPIVKIRPRTWEELKSVSGAFVRSDSIVKETNPLFVLYQHRNTFATKEQAEACIALAQLSQLMKVYNDGWVPDWTNSSIYKHVVSINKDKIDYSTRVSMSSFLVFKDQKTAKLFIENFRDLIIIAKPLL